jgi:RNase adaptor protein for sRNA GlmZ degradation
MAKQIRITIEGEAGAGKSLALQALRDAGWKVSSEEIVQPNNVIRATATMPRRTPSRPITYRRPSGAIAVEK